MLTKYKPINYVLGERLGWDFMREERLKRLDYASTQVMRHLPELEPHEGRCAIVGAGPSIEGCLDKIKEIKSEEFGLVMSINGAHDWLIKHGIVPDIHVLFEIDLEEVEKSTGGPLQYGVYYYVCSHCHQKVFEQLKNHKKVLWHFYDDPPEYQQAISKHFPGEFMVSGGFVTFFRSLNIGIILGYRSFDLFGCDASYEGESSHYDGYKTTSTEVELVVAAGTENDYRLFKTIPSLSFQAHEFMNFCAANQGGLGIRIHGDGLMKYLHQLEYPEQYN